jgi:hypothetical protein
MLTIATRVLFLVIGAVIPAIADAQPLGTFFWRMEPYCNVLTLDVIREGNVFRVQGSDDWCNAGPLPVRGTAVVGGDGRIYMGLTVTPRNIGYTNQPETAGMFISVALDFSSGSGHWRDNRADSGAFVLLPGRVGTPNPPRLLGHGTRTHTTLPENTTENRTCLPISDPDAKLLVEYNRRQASGLGPNVLSTISVFYADQGTGLQTPGLTGDVWCIRLERANAVMPLNATFTVQVLP